MQLQQLFESSAWHLVLVKDGIARVLPEDKFAEAWQLRDEGWKLVWDSARDEAAGYAYAEQHYGAVPDDAHHPKTMTEPKVLYRAVSLPELRDILATGVITGKQNTFNDFDTRRYVFFGDRMSKKLIAQGEEVERQASVAMGSDAIHKAFERLQRELKDLGAIAVRKARAKGLRGLGEDRLGYAESGDAYSIAQVFGELRDWDGVDRANRLMDTERGLQDKYRALHQAHSDRIRTQLVREPFTSAVLQTKPLTGGLHYSNAHGMSGMGDEDEYGFRSGQVTLADIDRIYLVKRGKVVGKKSPDEMRQGLGIG